MATQVARGMRALPLRQQNWQMISPFLAASQSRRGRRQLNQQPNKSKPSRRQKESILHEQKVRREKRRRPPNLLRKNELFLRLAFASGEADRGITLTLDSLGLPEGEGCEQGLALGTACCSSVHLITYVRTLSCQRKKKYICIRMYR
jgi:hypothetical protein